jgi:hypothetical protein
MFWWDCLVVTLALFFSLAAAAQGGLLLHSGAMADVAAPHSVFQFVTAPTYTTYQGLWFMY